MEHGGQREQAPLSGGGWGTTPHIEALHRRRIAILEEEATARRTLYGWRKLTLVPAVLLFLGALIAWTVPVIIALNAMMVSAYLLVILFRLYMVHRGNDQSRSLAESTAGVDTFGDDTNLPVYTLLCPLYHEAPILGQFLKSVCNLDYPLEKLDVRLLIEADDPETQAAAYEAIQRLDSPASVEIVIVPDSVPKTKPKACNFGLLDARGEYVVIYDAEDIPERDQLRRVLAMFAKCPSEVICVQARLNFYNPRQNLLTRFFTAEYSLWFDLFLPGLSAMGSPIPLGGTSNHFKIDRLLELGAWDPFNVTEDADLGVRIAVKGYRVAIVDSTTWEEANSRTGNWIRQRSRWVKGYIQVWLVAMRNPLRLLQTLGPWRFFCFHATIGGTPLVLLMNPINWLVTLTYVATAWDMVPEIFPTSVLLLSLLSGVFGNLSFIYLSILGVLKREQYGLVPIMFLSPVYWVLQSIAAWKGLIQLITKPHFWEKTQHGLWKTTEP